MPKLIFSLKYLILGMSDLLSPFVVIFEDNADAFWCFEMLLRRMVFANLTKFQQCNLVCYCYLSGCNDGGFRDGGDVGNQWW